MHGGYMNNSAALNQGNFKYNYQGVSGSASTFLFLGIGGFNTSKIVEDAKKELLRKHPLKSNQALANVTVNWRNSFYIIAMSTTCTISADIIEFTSNQEDNTEYTNKDLNNEKDTVYLSKEFIIGTTWVNKNLDQELILYFYKKGKAILTDIRYNNNNVIIHESKINYSYIYTRPTLKLTDINNLSTSIHVNETNLTFNNRIFTLK